MAFSYRETVQGMAPFFVLLASLVINLSPVRGAMPTSNKENWGNWQYTTRIVAAIIFRSRCLSATGGGSKWAFQFKNRADRALVFVEREQRGAEESTVNEWSRPAIVSLERNELSPIYETEVHGSCTEVGELKIEVLCNTEDFHIPGLDCFHDATGAELEHKRAPASASPR